MEQKSFTLDFAGTSYNAFYIKDHTDAKRALEILMAKDCLFAIDTETAALPEYKMYPDAALSPHLSEVRLIQVFDGKSVVVFDVKSFSTSQLQATFLPFLSSKRFIGHFALFDLMQFMKMGVVDMNLGCTYILLKHLQHAFYADDVGQGASLEVAVKKFLGVDISKQCQASDWSEPELTFEQVEYAALDPLVTYLLAEKLAPGLAKYGLEKIYKLSKDAQHPIAQMQLNGIKLDKPSHLELIPKWTEELVIAKRKVEKITGIKKLTAPKLSEWLETNLDPQTLAVWPRTESGKLGTDANTFVDFGYLPIVAPFAEFQKKAILCSTFGQKLINQINPKTGRLHAGYKICGARTGRLSCTNPNLQNLPRDGEVRSNFIAEERSLFLCADYSQIELRIIAEMSNDKRMQKAFRDGIDVHRLTASAVLGKRIEDVSDKERQIGKALGLGLLYGLGARKFTHYVKKGYAKDGISVNQSQAEDFIESYRETYSGVRAWQQLQAESCKISLKATTPFGKVRKLSDDNHYGGGLNVPIQGAAAEVMLCALVRLEKAFRGKGRLVNCVHDEVVIEFRNMKPDKSRMAARIMQSAMVKAYQDVFPNGITRDLIEVGVGSTWAASKKKENTIKLLAA